MKENELFEISVAGGRGALLAPGYHDDAFEFIEVVRGSAEITVGLTKVKAPTGSILHLVPGSVRYAVASGDEECFIRVIAYRRSVITAYDRLDERILSLYLLPIENHAGLFLPDHPLHAGLSFHMENAVSEWRGKELFHTSVILAEITHMISAVLREYGYRDEADPEYYNMMRMAPTVEFVLSHYSEKLRLEELAEHLFLSPDHFGKLFRQTVGLTPIEYVNYVRICAALRLLASTDWVIADISKAAGFANANYFHKVFRDLVGIGPAALRKQWKAMKSEIQNA